MSEKKRVVIIGGGYGGVEAAKALDSKFQVTLVERRPTFFHCVASVRVAVEPELVPDVYISYDNLLKNGKFVMATATEITPDHVTLDNGTTLEFDYLVIATGSNILAPFKAPIDLKSNRDIQQYFNNFSEQIKQAKSILIVGGGSVGIEFAGEIRDKYPKDKAVTVVHSGSTLVNNQMVEKFNNSTLKAMEKRNVKVILNDRINLPDNVAELLRDQSSFSPSNESKIYTTEKGQEIQADLVVYTVGIKVNNEAFASNSQFKNAVNQQGQLKVNSSLQVEGFNNIFAIGDITDIKEFKSAYNASNHGKHVGKVIIAHSKSSSASLPTYTASKPVMLLSLGKNDGVLQLPNGMVFGSFLSKTLKSKNLLIKRTADGLNNPKKLIFN